MALGIDAQDNYDKYLKQNIRIGFTESFPIKEVLEEFEIRDKCRNYDVVYKVKYCIVTFGDNNEFTCHAVVTDSVNIGSRMGAFSFGSHCYADEAETMEKGVVEMLKKKNLLASKKICSWPFAKVIVTENNKN